MTSKGQCFLIQIFAKVLTMGEKQILARVLELKKKNVGNHAFFTEI